MSNIRCITCGLFNCKHVGLQTANIHEQLHELYHKLYRENKVSKATMGTYESIYGKKTASDAVSFSEQKKKLLKEFYSEIQRAQARTPEDWYKCSVCSGIVHLAYRDNHANVHGNVAKVTWAKIDNLNTVRVDSDGGVLTVEESLSKLNKACEGCTGDEACCALVGLKAAGWDVEINPAMAYGDRKGYQITILEPKNKE